MTINLYGLTFHSYDYAKKSIDSILNTSSDDINLTVVDNLSTWESSGSDKIREMLRAYVKGGIIKRAVLMDGNYWGWALVTAMKDFLLADHLADPNPSDFFFLTDLDLIVDCDWIKETREAHSSGAVLTGFGLQTINYLPPNDGYSPYGFGLHMVAANRELYVKHFGLDTLTVDCQMINTFGQLGKVQKLDSDLYHQTWDVFVDDPVYAAEKRKLGVGWVHNNKPENMRYELVC
jgi:hypothetical protein